jgi:hypothetical protein
MPVPAQDVRLPPLLASIEKASRSGALGRIPYWLMSLHFLFVGLACGLVRVALSRLSSVSHGARIALGVAAGEQNGCGEHRNQRNLIHRSSSTRFTAIHHPPWVLA